MSLVPWNPFREMDNFSKDISNLIDFSPFRFFGGMNSPRVDVFQTDAGLCKHLFRILCIVIFFLANYPGNSTVNN